MTELDRIVGVFHSPTRVFRDIRERPRWVAPVVLIVVFSILFSAFIVGTGIGFEERKEQITERIEQRGLEEKEKQQAIEQAMEYSTGLKALALSSLSLLITTPILLILMAAILNVGSSLLGGTTSFILVFSVVCYSGLVRIAAIIVKALLITITGSIDVHTDLSLLAPFLGKENFIYSFLSKIDIFTIWELFLVGLGLTIVTGLARKKSYIMVFGLFAAVVILVTIVGRLFG